VAQLTGAGRAAWQAEALGRGGVGPRIATGAEEESTMRALQSGDRGPRVRRWQTFLLGQGFDPQGVDGKFGGDTKAATEAFQRKFGLPVTGMVDNRTLGQAALLGFEVVEEPDDGAPTGPGFPPIPVFKPLLGTRARQEVFGRFAFVPDPRPDNPEHIKVTDGWAQDNLVTVELPQLRGLRDAPGDGRVRWHRMAAGQLRDLWQAWDDAGMLDRVLRWSGAYAPRFIRGSTTTLSNHAFGTAFDINFDWNRLGAEPARAGEEGSVRELVPLAHAHGFYWGGHFRTRPDGMHFEVALPRG
jgi:hypothetical protein